MHLMFVSPIIGGTIYLSRPIQGCIGKTVIVVLMRVDLEWSARSVINQSKANPIYRRSASIALSWSAIGARAARGIAPIGLGSSFRLRLPTKVTAYEAYCTRASTKDYDEQG